MSAKRLKALEQMGDIFSEIMHSQIMKKKSEPQTKKDEPESEESEPKEEKDEPKEEVKAPAWVSKVKAPEKKG